MKRSLTFLLAAFLSTVCYGQAFEGKIVYKNSYSSKMPNVTDQQLTTMMGPTQEYYIKGGDYKNTSDGSLLEWQLYSNRENKLYTKMAYSDTLLWNDAAVTTDEVLKSEINKGVTTILGYTCDELILTCKSGVQKYYFNTKFSADPQLFVNHKFGNWYDFLSRSNALPLKFTVDNEQFHLESEAVSAEALTLDNTIFELPANTQSIKSPY